MKLIPLFAVLTLLAGAAPAPALAGDDHDEARALLSRGEILPLGRILQIAQARVPGDVIEVELERDDGVWRYEVKVLTSTGRVREVKLDARNGAVLEIEDD